MTQILEIDLRCDGHTVYTAADGQARMQGNILHLPAPSQVPQLTDGVSATIAIKLRNLRGHQKCCKILRLRRNQWGEKGLNTKELGSGQVRG